MPWSPNLIDLTRPMTRETIVELAGKIVAEPSPYNEVELEYLRSWETDNGSLCQWKLNDHFGTHLDAPIHIVPDSPSVDRVDIDRLVGAAVVIDCSFANGRGLPSAAAPCPRLEWLAGACSRVGRRVRRADDVEARS